MQKVASVGVLEMMQDCTHIRELTGSQTLLTWAGKEEESAANTTPSDNEDDEASAAAIRHSY